MVANLITSAIELAKNFDDNMTAIFPGWNVWKLYATDPLPFSLLDLGLSDERRVRIFVEDWVRTKSDAKVADPLALKGSMVQVIAGVQGLVAVQRREDVDGPLLTIKAPVKEWYVRFFNRAGDANTLLETGIPFPQASVPWPHSPSIVLDRVYLPTKTSQITLGGPPPTIAGSTGAAIASTVDEVIVTPAGKTVLPIVGAAVVLGALYFAAKSESRRRK